MPASKEALKLRPIQLNSPKSLTHWNDALPIN
jgi:hypothetical protein